MKLLGTIGPGNQNFYCDGGLNAAWQHNILAAVSACCWELQVGEPEADVNESAHDS
jgi:hypothetical protein